MTFGCFAVWELSQKKRFAMKANQLASTIFTGKPCYWVWRLSPQHVKVAVPKEVGILRGPVFVDRQLSAAAPVVVESTVAMDGPTLMRAASLRAHTLDMEGLIPAEG
eukprot:694154-Amphidinium_carterae.1